MTYYFLKKTTWTQSAGLFGNILLRCQRFSHFLTRLCVLVEGKYYYFLAGSWFPWPVSQFTNLPKSKWATSGSDRRPDTQLYDTDTDRYIYKNRLKAYYGYVKSGNFKNPKQIPKKRCRMTTSSSSPSPQSTDSIWLLKAKVKNATQSPPMQWLQKKK